LFRNKGIQSQFLLDFAFCGKLTKLTIFENCLSFWALTTIARRDVEELRQEAAALLKQRPWSEIE
jgi:hypothetical protein